MKATQERGVSRRRKGRAGAWALAAAAVVVASGCRRDEVTRYRVPKETPAPMGARAPTGGPAMGAAGDLPPPPAMNGGGLEWTLPKGWKQEVAGGMRYATFEVPVQGRLDASVVVLPGEAGGELANVNRWRGQIGLPPVEESALASARKVVRTKAGAFSLYDFTSDGQVKTRVVAALAEERGNTWFLKLTGDAGAVAAARNDFLRLLESARFE